MSALLTEWMKYKRRTPDKTEQADPMKIKTVAFQTTKQLSIAASFIAMASVSANAQTAADLCDDAVVQSQCVESIPTSELVNVFGYEEGDTGRRLRRRNLRVARILSRLDIDGDGLPDLAPDTDGDGLPDNWETGGIEGLTADQRSVDRVVFYPAPSAIVPGTPPTPIFSRLAVATSALNPDTDGDGISDFVEVFGLLFIDENRNGILDSSEWQDKNGDGLPSPGEFPIDNSGSIGLNHDFDGFIFTDPTNPDTDGDGKLDLTEDDDPLINPRAFGNTSDVIFRFDLGEDFADLDFDGLGNGMDMGNDIRRCQSNADIGCDGPNVQTFQSIDNPPNVGDLIEIFRSDLLEAGVVPESAIEDLLGVDWDGNGLWRLTDVRTWHIVIDPDMPDTLPQGMFAELFANGDGTNLYATQTFAELAQLVNDDPTYDPYGGGAARRGDNLETPRGVGLGWQDLLAPSGTTDFLPDPRVWAILYSWRMPGFDIDGDGFVGAPTLSSTAQNDANCDENGVCTASVALELQDGRLVLVDDADRLANIQDEPFDDRINITNPALLEEPQQDRALDGRIVAPVGFPSAQTFCGTIGMFFIGLNFVALVGAKRRWRK